MSFVIPFDDYIASLRPLGEHADPTAITDDGEKIKRAAESLEDLDELTIESLAEWVAEHPDWVPALGLAVGLTQERLKNNLVDTFNTAGWVTLARTRSTELIEYLNSKFDLIRLVDEQVYKSYNFGDILVARGGTRLIAKRAGVSGRRLEDEIESIALNLGLACETRTRFTGRNNRTAPCDLVIPNGSNAEIAIAAKVFDSTGSKLTDAVREVLEMGEVRKPRQFIIAVIDGIGWKSRRADLQRIHDLWEQGQIDGMYSLASFASFRNDLEEAARLRGLVSD
jgi:hypothetical protein